MAKPEYIKKRIEHDDNNNMIDQSTLPCPVCKIELHEETKATNG